MADKTLIIVESPAKTRTIKNYLGADYEVMASMGHVRDLPKDGLGVDVEHHFAPAYVNMKEKTETLSKLRKAAQAAKVVFLAMDPDREGEAIAWHLHEALNLHDAKRIEFNEITKQAITHALEHPRDIDMQRVNAQQARRVLDRLVGYQLSPLLWKKVRRGTSAGRVQSAAMRLICDREREILAFITEEYWTVIAQLAPQQPEPTQFAAKLIERDGVKIKLTNAEDSAVVVDALRDASYRIIKVKVSEQKRNPQPPFITSTLQQEASRAFGYTAKRTMAVAQQLYEGLEMGEEGHVGLITYMRTDSTRIAEEAQEAALNYINEYFGAEYVPKVERKAKAVKGSQDAHEAIRPSDVFRTPEMMTAHLTADQLKLYRLIWKRFLASQMASARLEVMVVDVQAGIYTLRANGQRVKFPGYLTLSPDRQESEFLPAMSEGDMLNLLDLLPEQHFTKPPARYTEATLVKSLESHGVGRPSTYATIIGTIQDRRYALLEDKKFHPTGLGMVVNEQLEKHFANIVNLEFTADMEGKLDAVESGEEDWVTLLERFYDPFEKALTAAAENMERIKVPDVMLEQVCPECGKPLALREGKFGKFVACTGFPECKFTAQEEEFLKEKKEQIEGEEAEPAEALPEVLCELCNAPMMVRHSRRGPFYGCTNYPACKGTMPMPNEDGTVPVKKEPAQLTGIPCEKCGRPMAIRISKRGKFLGCSGFPRCRSIKPMPEGEIEILPPAPIVEKEKKPRKTAVKRVATPKAVAATDAPVGKEKKPRKKAVKE